MRRGALGLALAAGLIAAATSARAEELAVPTLERRINDLAGLLPVERSDVLEARLAAYEDRTGHQFAVLIIPRLEGQPIEDFAIRVAEAWKLGDASRDDGLLFVVSKDDRKMRIEVGYGLEGAVTDLGAKRVLDRVQGFFRAGDFAGGLEEGVGALMRLAEGESVGPAPAPRNRAPQDLTGKGFSPGLLIVLMVAVLLGRWIAILAAAGVAAVAASYGAGGLMAGAALGALIALMGFRGGRSGGGGFIFLPDGDSFGGGGGGGFDSFDGGGGDFGGGGASGDW
ncbi:MAG: TPM domain-containing protein [Myxococcota bacterium]